MTISCAKEFHALLESRRSALVDLASLAVCRTPGLKPYSRADMEQIIAGLLAAIFEALEEGSRETLNFFVETVIPGLIQNGETVSTIVHGTLVFISCVTMDVSQSLQPEHRDEVIPWLANFWGEYVSALVVSGIQASHDLDGPGSGAQATSSE
jgi:hypothetical protein